MGQRADKFVKWYVSFLQRRSIPVILIGLALTVVAGISASRFQLKTNFAELLPQDEPSVKDLNRAKARKGGLSNLIVAVIGEDVSANKKFVDDLVAKFEELPPEYLVYMKYEINSEKKFYEKNKHLYADLGDLKTVHERLREKIRYERIKNNPVLNMDFDGEELKPVEFDISDIKEKYEKKTSSYNKYVDGYFTEEGGGLFAILIYPPETSTGVSFGKRMIKTIKKTILEVCSGDLPVINDDTDLDSLISKACKKRYHPSTSVGLTGSVVTAIDEQEAIIADLVLVTSICLFFVGLVVLLYFRHFRAIPVIGMPLLMGTCWTFGISIYIVEHLNTSTAFLAAIIVGNGINFGLIQLARYIEERRSGLEPAEAMNKALKYTASATSTAAMAASIAYGSLIITDFRGFNGFGYMGGLGMVLCWLSAFTIQPAIMLFLGRVAPVKFKKSRHFGGGFFSKPFAKFVSGHGYSLHVIAILFGVVCIIAILPYIKDPFEYDFRNLRNQTARDKGSGALSSRVDKIFPRRLNPLFIMADRYDQVPMIMEELERNNSVGPYRALFHEIKSVYSYLPQDQKDKIKILKKIRRQLSESTLSWLSDDDREQVEKFRPPDDLHVLTKEDLPNAITRIFSEKDGRMGLPIALYPRHGRSTWDGHFLIELSDASRTVSLPDGEIVTSAGVPTIFADMLKAIERDGPRAIIVSLLGVIILVIFAFRSFRFIVLTIISLMFSVIWTVGPAAMMDLKLNFLNFIALPITFGIGVDYAVNVLNRYKFEGIYATRQVIESTGGAVILCSLTTLIGYSSLLIADNQALVSFGILSDIGELASLAAAVLLLPAIILISERRRVRLKSQKTRAKSA
jgi:predicted RND superfamily exporter protein